jgi:hypothetical protein
MQLSGNHSPKMHCSSDERSSWKCKTNSARDPYSPLNNPLFKSIDQQKVEKIQERIMSMGIGLSTNTTVPQGYKPKSKCWGNAELFTARVSEFGNSGEHRVKSGGGWGSKNGVSGMRFGKA